MAPIALVIVGCGRMGRAHLEAAGDVAEVDVVAVVDPLLDAGEPHGLGPPAMSLDDALAGRPVNALLVAAPTRAHEDLVRHALMHGKHVLCEKPLTLDPAADLELDGLASERGLVLQVGFWRRFAEPYLLARELLAAGHIGTVSSIRAAQWDAVPPPAAFCDPRISGGLEIDCGVHEFDMARWLLGCEVEEVAARSPTPSAEAEAAGDVDTVCGLARMAGDQTLMVDLTRTAGYMDSIRTELIGTRGALITEFADTGSVVLRRQGRRDVVPLTVCDVIADALRAQLRAFARAVRTGQADAGAGTAADSAMALSAAQALRDARADGRWHDVTNDYVK
jgi:predicted dehydrogenase